MTEPADGKPETTRKQVYRAIKSNTGLTAGASATILAALGFMWDRMDSNRAAVVNVTAVAAEAAKKAEAAADKATDAVQTVNELRLAFSEIRVTLARGEQMNDALRDKLAGMDARLGRAETGIDVLVRRR